MTFVLRIVFSELGEIRQESRRTAVPTNHYVIGSTRNLITSLRQFYKICDLMWEIGFEQRKSDGLANAPPFVVIAVDDSINRLQAFQQ